MVYLVLFLFWPVIEIALLIKIGGAVGVVSTLLLLVVMAVMGGALVQYQGLKTASAARNSLERGELPVREIFDGFCLFAAGVLLLIPGFFSDIVAFSLLLPPVRQMLHRKAGRFFAGSPESRPAAYREDVIEAEFTRMDDDPEDPRLLS